MSDEKIGIGSTIWMRGEYSKQASETKICGETARSWLVSRGQYADPFRIAKVGLDSRGERWSAKLEREKRLQVFFSLAEVEEWEAKKRADQELWKWLSANRDGIRYSVDKCQDIAILRQVAALVGYEEKP